jgi:phosphate starvation-inducible PhoH-like protein
MTIRHELSKKITSSEISFDPVNNNRLLNLCGRFDEHLRHIERRLGVEIHNRGGTFQIFGKQKAVNAARELLDQLYAETENNQELKPARVHLHLQESAQKLDQALLKKPEKHPLQRNYQSDIVIPTPNEGIVPRTQNQALYVQNILAHDVNFGIGPAGTGKTYLAVACAIAALEAHKVRRIILVRPAVEAGERLGFLPGDLSQKIDPYLRPLYDALYEMLGVDRVVKLIERHVIELAPLAYMRGRTLSDAFIILDESQNTTREQMKMFLTRLGFGSTAIITGDITQIDLPHGMVSGLKHAIKVFDNIPGMSFTYFDSKDVVRHPIVQRIIEAYDAFENPPETRGKP